MKGWIIIDGENPTYAFTCSVLGLGSGNGKWIENHAHALAFARMKDAEEFASVYCRHSRPMYRQVEL